MAKEKLKIAFLNINQGYVNRGAETFINEIADRLKPDFQVDIISGGKPPTKRWSILWRIFLDPHGLTILWFSLKSLTKIWREKYDVVIPLNGGWQSVVIRLITLAYGGKMVISGQSGKGWDDRFNLYTFPNAFVAITQTNTAWAKNFNKSINVKFIPNGVDLSKFKSNGETYNTKLKKPIIITVAALTETKRVDLAVNAVSRISDASLLIVGDGHLKDKLKKLADEKLPERYEIICVQYSQMPSMYRAADMFCLAP
ncbi:glycosyltransferase, partial [Candidatus Microgenomates bacterium]|nr:glycosyltransferase [Candidatus Microgenomates bacterium]